MTDTNRDLRQALTAANITPQKPKQNKTKSKQDFVSLNPEKVAEVMLDAETALEDLPSPYGTAKELAHALCEAAKRGELS